MSSDPATTIHPTAIVDSGATIGAGSRIWHWVHVSAGAVIGRRCSLGQGVFVGNRVRIGDGCKIQNHVSVYDNVTLEDGVFCGPSMVFTNVYNPRAAVARKAEAELAGLLAEAPGLPPVARQAVLTLPRLTGDAGMLAEAGGLDGFFIARWKR